MVPADVGGHDGTMIRRPRSDRGSVVWWAVAVALMAFPIAEGYAIPPGVLLVLILGGYA